MNQTDANHSLSLNVPIAESGSVTDIPVVVSFRLLGCSLAPISEALPFTEQVRRALIRNRLDTSRSEAITGKRADGIPLEGHEHAHYLPTDEDHDGRIDHITIYVPRGFDQADLEALRSLRTIFRSGNRPEVKLVLIGLDTSLPFTEFSGSYSTPFGT
jgi:CRISPR-associated protein Csb2